MTSDAPPPIPDAAAIVGLLADDDPADVARVLRSFFRDGRLVRIRAGAKRLLILDRLAQDFEVGVRYPERDVNRMLRTYHDDVAALRRYLVDDGYLDRAAGLYWRCGGSYAG